MHVNINCTPGVILPICAECNQTLLRVLTQSCVALVKLHSPKSKRKHLFSVIKLTSQTASSSPPHLFGPCLGCCTTGGPGERAFFFSAFRTISLCFSETYKNISHICVDKEKKLCYDLEFIKFPTYTAGGWSQIMTNIIINTYTTRVMRLVQCTSWQILPTAMFPNHEKQQPSVGRLKLRTSLTQAGHPAISVTFVWFNAGI